MPPLETGFTPHQQTGPGPQDRLEAGKDTVTRTSPQQEQRLRTGLRSSGTSIMERQELRTLSGSQVLVQISSSDRGPCRHLQLPATAPVPRVLLVWEGCTAQRAGSPAAPPRISSLPPTFQSPCTLCSSDMALSPVSGCF